MFICQNDAEITQIRRKLHSYGAELHSYGAVIFT
ncbi:hypothetical protein VPHK394_0064 [Vibrio phage K394]